MYYDPANKFNVFEIFLNGLKIIERVVGILLNPNHAFLSKISSLVIIKLRKIALS